MYNFTAHTSKKLSLNNLYIDEIVSCPQKSTCAFLRGVSPSCLKDNFSIIFSLTYFIVFNKLIKVIDKVVIINILCN